MSDIPALALNDGNTIPQLGFGVYQIRPQDAADAVLGALETGYRHIDTAEMYQNETGVGEGVQQSGIDRSQIFITSKLNNGKHRPEDAKTAFEETLTKLGSDYIDLFLIHLPLPTQYDGDYVSTWKALESFKKDGRAKSVGVSNFQIDHLKKLADQCELPPAVNQIELHPYFQNREVSEYCQSHNILVEAWSPIGQGGDLLKDPVLTGIADEIGKSTAQVVLRWHIQKGHIIFPKSSTAERVRENFEIFDFELTPEQMFSIDALDKGPAGRMGPDPSTFDMIPS